MKAKDWSELKRLFEEVEPLDANARVVALDEVRSDNPTMADELVALLSRSELPSGSATGIVSSAAEGYESSLRADIIGKCYGAYRVVSHLAHGGMGEVYLGDRDDGAFEQRVAIKLIGHGPRTADAERRFAVERQILARVDHPNIARILDGGTTPEGVAYLIMEYVEGVAIDDYCRDNKLSVRQCLELFRLVCGAIEYAHQNLVVHRDIKPSNILVTESGVPKLLDFGIAKLLNDDGNLSKADETLASSRAMTPDFASPEQVLGQPVTTSSDVYALGILLYVMLTGQKPYSTTGLSPGALEKVVVATLPARPSQAVLQRAGSSTTTSGNRKSKARRLRGDLDDIVLRALRKEPEQRYGSAQQLSADVRRHLQGRPVVARGHTLSYVAWKFLQRHLVPVATGFVVLFVGVAAAIYHNNSITEERDHVRAEAEKAAATAQFLVDIFNLSDPDESLGATITAKEMLDSGAERLAHDLEEQPEIRAALGTTIGSVYGYLGLYEEAEQQLAAAVQIREELGDHPAIAESLSELANMQYELDKLDESRTSYERVLETRLRVLPSDHLDIAVTLNDLGHLIYAQGDYETALDHYQRALDMFERLGATRHESYPDTLHDVGQIQQLQGDLVSAEKHIRQAVEFGLEHYGEQNSITLTYLVNHATVLYEMDRFTAAEALYLRVYKLERELLGENHPDLDATMTNLGRLYLDMNRLDDAESYLRDAAKFAARTRGPRHTFTAYDMVNLANLLTITGEHAEAQEIFADAISIYDENLEPDHPYIASASAGYAALLNQMGRPFDSQQHSQRALDICASALPPGHWLTAKVSSVAGESLMLLGDLDTAESLLLDGYAGLAVARPRDRITVNALRRLEQYYELRGNSVEATRYRDLADQLR